MRERYERLESLIEEDLRYSVACISPHGHVVYLVFRGYDLGEQRNDDSRRSRDARAVVLTLVLSSYDGRMTAGQAAKVS